LAKRQQAVSIEKSLTVLLCEQTAKGFLFDCFMQTVDKIGNGVLVAVAADNNGESCLEDAFSVFLAKRLCPAFEVFAILHLIAVKCEEFEVYT
jgi:hypothetical protein